VHDSDRPQHVDRKRRAASGVRSTIRRTSSSRNGRKTPARLRACQRGPRLRHYRTASITTAGTDARVRPCRARLPPPPPPGEGWGKGAISYARIRPTTKIHDNRARLWVPEKNPSRGGETDAGLSPVLARRRPLRQARPLRRHAPRPRRPARTAPARRESANRGRVTIHGRPGSRTLPYRSQAEMVLTTRCAARAEAIGSSRRSQPIVKQVEHRETMPRTRPCGRKSGREASCISTPSACLELTSSKLPLKGAPNSGVSRSMVYERA